MRDSELNTGLAQAICQAGGQFRFYVPKDARESKRDMLRRYAQRFGTVVQTRCVDDTMWVTVHRTPQGASL